MSKSNSGQYTFKMNKASTGSNKKDAYLNKRNTSNSNSQRLRTGKDILPNSSASSITDRENAAKTKKPTSKSSESQQAKNRKFKHTDHTQLRSLPLVNNKALPPKTHVELKGQEVMRVVEDLMEQTAILKTRLVDMIGFFHETIGTCADMLQQSSDLHHSICTCKSSVPSTNVCRSKGGASSVASEFSNHTPATLLEKLPAAQPEKIQSSQFAWSNQNNIDQSPDPRLLSYSHNKEPQQKINETSASHKLITDEEPITTTDTIGHSTGCTCSHCALKAQGIEDCHKVSRLVGSGTPVSANMETRRSVLGKRPSELGCIANMPRPVSRSQSSRCSKVSEHPAAFTALAPNQVKVSRHLKEPQQPAAFPHLTPYQENNPRHLKETECPAGFTALGQSKVKSPSHQKREPCLNSATLQHNEYGVTESRYQAGTTLQNTTADNYSLHRPSNHTDLTSKVQQVQKDINELREKMNTFTGCACTCHYPDHSKAFAQTLSAQLLGKADEIKNLLKDLKSDCYQRVNFSTDDLPDEAQQIVHQKCEKKIERIHPEFTRTVNQVQSVKGDRKREGNTQLAKVTEALETNIDTQYKNEEAPENVILTTKVAATERIENISPEDKLRQTQTVAEKTVRTNEKAFHEVNTINEDDMTYKDGRIIKTSKKVVRTEIVEGSEPEEKIITNIKIRRVIDNKTGQMTETITEGDEISEDGASIQSSKSASIRFSDSVSRHDGGESKTTRQPGYHFTDEESGGSVSEFISKRFYEDDGIPPTKIRRTSSNTDLSSIVPIQHSQMKKTTKVKQSQQRTLPQRASAGTNIKETCSKVMYVQPNSDIPGVTYIGCKNSDMSKYPSYRSKISTDRHLITDSHTSKRSFRFTNPMKYSSTRKNYPSEKINDTKISAVSSTRNNKIADAGASCNASCHAGGEGLPQSPSESVLSPPTSPLAQDPHNLHETAYSTPQSRSTFTKPFFRERSNLLNRSVGGTSIQVSALDKPRLPSTKSPLSTRISAGEAPTSANEPSAKEIPKPTNCTATDIKSAECIAEVIRHLSGNRSPKDFFVSILPEKIEMKTFRINVIDKESGNLLGYFFVDEEQFKRARDNGVFDNYLSLFVLNSLGSYSDFVKMKSHLDPKGLHQFQCFGTCHCQKSENKDDSKES